MKVMKMTAVVGFGLTLSLYATGASAQLTNQGMLDQVVTEFATRASGWQTVVMNAATWLFWTLGTISLVWTGGMMALRKADIGEFFAEFIRFILFFGFFLWLLRNGPTFASSIIQSLQRIGEQASGVSSITPSGIVDIGFMIWKQAIANLSVWSPVDSVVGTVLSAGILVLLALIAVNMLLLLVSGWILMYAGIFFLGFGGSRWTSDLAISYYKTVLGVAVQLFAMVLLVGIGNDLLSSFYGKMTKGTLNFEELGVMLVFCVALLLLVAKVPPLLAGVITGGGGGGASGIGNFGAGAAMGAAAMGGAAMAAGGAAIAGGAASMGGGAQALMAAIQKAQAYESAGGGGGALMAAAGGMAGKGDGGGRALAEAMGDPPRGGSSTGSSAKGGGMGSPRAPGAKGFSTGTEGRSHSGGGGAGASADAKGGGTKGGESGGANSGGAMAKAGRVAAGTAGNLAKGAWDVGKAKVSQGIQERVSQTFGGQVASAIKAQGAATASTAGATPEPSFEGNSVSWEDDTSVDAEAEIAAFRDRDSKPS